MNLAAFRSALTRCHCCKSRTGPTEDGSTGIYQWKDVKAAGGMYLPGTFIMNKWDFRMAGKTHFPGRCLMMACSTTGRTDRVKVSLKSHLPTNMPLTSHLTSSLLQKAFIYCFSSISWWHEKIESSSCCPPHRWQHEHSFPTFSACSSHRKTASRCDTDIITKIQDTLKELQHID